MGVWWDSSPLVDHRLYPFSHRSWARPFSTKFHQHPEPFYLSTCVPINCHITIVGDWTSWMSLKPHHPSKETKKGLIGFFSTKVFPPTVFPFPSFFFTGAQKTRSCSLQFTTVEWKPEQTAVEGRIESQNKWFFCQLRRPHSPHLHSPGRNFKHKPSWDKNIVLREYETCQFLKTF
jgi:hypothetical protein